MRSIALGFAAGAWWLHRAMQLQEVMAMGCVAITGALLLVCRHVLGAVYFRSPVYAVRAVPYVRCGLLVVAAGLAGYDWAAWRAHRHMVAVWPTAWEGRDVVLIGRIETMPVRVPTASTWPNRPIDKMPASSEWRVTLSVLHAMSATGVPRAQAGTHSTALLARGAAGEGNDERKRDQFVGLVQLRIGTSAAKAAVPQAGQVWRVVARLQRPHGAANFGMPMREAVLFQRGIRATGYARSAAPLHVKQAARRAGDGVFGGIWQLRPAVERVRSRIDDRIETVLGGMPHRGVISALALGLQSAIAADDWTRFTRTGTNHLVAVSGLHIGLAAGCAAWGAAVLLRRRCMTRLLLIVPRQRLVGLVSLVAAGAFVALSGFGIPAQRAFWMLTAYCVCGLDGRRVGATVMWCLALWLVVLVDPWAMQSAGGWLSFGAVGAILYLAAAMPRPVRPPGREGINRNRVPDDHDVNGRRFTMPHHPGEWRPLAPPRSEQVGVMATACTNGKPSSGGDARERAGDVAFIRPPQSAWSRPPWRACSARLWCGVWMTCRLQLALSLALAPATLVWFGETSPISPIANLLAIPWVSFIAVPAVFCGLVLPAPLDAMAWHVAHGAVAWLHQGLGWLIACASAVSSALGVADTIRVPAPSPLALTCACIGVLLWLAPRGAWPAQRVIASLLCLPLFLYRPALLPAGGFRITMYDIGQGNAVLVETQRHRLLYDTGPPYGASGDAGSQVIVPSLRREGVWTLDALVISHPHDDHYGGALSVMAHIPVRHLLASWPLPVRAAAGEGRHAASLPPLWRIAGARGTVRRRCRAGDTWSWDGVRFDTVWPLDPLRRAPPNHVSCVLRISNGVHAVLLAGDIEAPQEEALRKARIPLRADVLLAPHHGSATSSTSPFIQAVAPRHVVFQMGFRNRHRHPSTRVVPRYTERGVMTHRSDTDGAVRFISRNADMTVETLRYHRRRYWMTNMSD
ncbi:DNA internalization-related competence protein ComEC/Rec2 [Robbsia andropogonis]|uniref:DNA internalization-related competence protein ComEC/Rec2 n=1 Tax=Robbsia andropogonis TaxID=28092 RepID=UPI000466AE77|nr:DNA internalization-related competence protein ComEC/Rec2 [Robbsia andropogonis]